MKLFEIIGRDGILRDLEATTRDEAIFELVAHMCDQGRIPEEEQEEITLALLKREALASTQFDHGVAIPHAKLPNITNFMGVVGISANGIDFWSSDGKGRVHVIFLFLSPERAISGHLQLMAHISGIIRHPEYVRRLQEARGRKELEELVQATEAQIFQDEDEPLL